MMRKYIVLSAFISFVISFALNAAPITAIDFEGLKKTKEFILQGDVEKFIGKENDEKTIHELETLLQKEGLFSEIELVQVEVENGIEIKAKVKEKITFIPLPLFSASDGDVMGGGFVIDTNAFGLKHTLAVGGFFSSAEYRGIFMYGRPQKNRFPGITIFSSFGKKNQEYVNIDDEKCIDYNMTSANCGIAFTEQITNLFAVKMSANFGFKNFDERDEGKIRSNRYVHLEPSIGFSNSDWNGVFMSTKGIYYSHNSVFYTDRYIWHIFNPIICFQHPIFSDDLRFILNSSGIYSKFIPYSAYVGNGKLSVNILPTKFATRNGVGFSSGFEYATFKTRIGLFSVYGVYQFAEVEDFDEEYKFNQGAGGGVTMYLKQIAIPAMNFGIFYNTTKRIVSSSFSLGMTF